LYIGRYNSNSIYFESVAITRNDGSTPVIDELTLVDGEDYTATEDRTYADGVTFTKTFTNANKWAALYVPFAINVEDYSDQFDIAEIYAVCPVKDTNNDGEINADDDAYLISYNKKTGLTLPNKPYMIRPKTVGTYQVKAVDNKTYAATNGTITCSTTKNRYTFTGIYSSVVANTENAYWYMSTSGNLSHRVTGSTTIKSNRWHMSSADLDGYSSTAGSQNQNAIEILVVGEDIDNATAINAIKQNINQSNDIMYNLNGQKISISSAPKGIYIRNGVKVIK